MGLEENMKGEAAAFTDPVYGFGRKAIYNGGSTIDVIFDNLFVDVSPFDGGVETSSPFALAKETDVPTVVQGETLEIDAVVYKIVEVHRNLQPGLTGLKLSED